MGDGRVAECGQGLQEGGDFFFWEVELEPDFAAGVEGAFQKKGQAVNFSTIGRNLGVGAVGDQLGKGFHESVDNPEVIGGER